MSDLILGARLEAKGGSLVGQLSAAEISARGLEGALENTGQTARELDNAVAGAGQAMARTSGAAQNLAAAEELLASAQQTGSREAVRQAQASLDLTRAFAATDAAIGRLATAQAEAQREIAAATAALKAGEIGQVEYNRSIIETKTALGLVETEYRETTTALRKLTAGQDAAAEAGAGGARQQAAAYQQLGFQMQDVFQQAALGVNPLVILAQQGGQTASAIALMGTKADGTTSRFVKFATFLSGPWGAALFGAATIIGFLVQGMLEAGDAAEEGESKAFNFAGGLDVLALSAGDAKTAMDQLSNSLRGAIVLQGSFIRGEAAIAQQKAEQLKAQIRADSDEVAQLRANRSGAGATFLPSLFGPSAEDIARERELDRRLAANRAALPAALQASATGALVIAQRDVEESFEPLLGKIRQVDEEIAKLNARFEQTKRGDDPLALSNISDDEFARQFSALFQQRKALEEQQRDDRRSPGSGIIDRRSVAAADRAQEQLENFGESAAEKVNRVLAEYDPAPRGLDKAQQQLRELDKLIVELGEREPPGFEETIKSAEQARRAVQDGLADPITDIEDSFSNMPRDLAAAGAALADLDAIAAQISKINPPNLAELLAQIDQARGAVNDSLVRPFKEILADQERGIALQRLAIEGRNEEAEQLAFIHNLMVQVGAENEEQLATELLKRGVTAEMLEQMIANLGIERQLTEETGRRLAIQQEHLREVQAFRSSIEQFFSDIPARGIKALGDFAENVQGQTADFFARYLTETLFGGAFRQIEDQLSGRDQLRKANEAYVRQVEAVVASLRALEGAASDAAVAQGGEIVVKAPAEEGEEDPFDFRLKSPKEMFRDIVGPLFEELGIDKDLASDIGAAVGQALEGVAIGQSASQLLLGDKGSNTGASVGGVLGGLAGSAFGPVGAQIGAAIGGVLGGVVGGLFKSAPRGSSVISGTGEGGFSVSGNKGEVRDSLSAASSSVQDGLSRIAGLLDAEVGGFNVSIGQFKDKFRVSASGSAAAGDKKFAKNAGSDLVFEGTDAQAAVAAALRNALEDGAIFGVSNAVKQALLSTSDIEEAVRKALAVKEVEDILSGMGEAWVKELRAFEKTAEERLRIGREFGFDLVALEKHNAEERNKLIEDILQSRVGALKDLLDDLKFGDLAEGTLSDRRAALLGEVSKAEAEADQGVEGAAAKLAQLQRDLIALSLEAFGTAGAEFGADRDQAIASAERIIAQEEERVRNVQAELTDRLDTGNAIANEGNDILSEIRAGIDRLAQIPLAGVTDLGGRVVDTTRELAR